MTYKTRQELFDNAWRGFESQNWAKAMTSDGESCLYRVFDEKGNKTACCGIGWNIPDEDYYSDFEYRSVDDADIQKAVRLDPKNCQFASDLQLVHDDSNGNLKDSMIEFAKQEGLTIPEAVK